MSAPVSGEPDPPTPGLRGQPPSDQPQSGLLFYLPGLTGLCKADQDLEEQFWSSSGKLALIRWVAKSMDYTILRL